MEMRETAIGIGVGSTERAGSRRGGGAGVVDRGAGCEASSRACGQALGSGGRAVPPRG